EHACHACHTVGESGGYYGPNLDLVGDRLEPGYMNAQLLNPQRFNRRSREPNFGLSEEHALALTAYLMTLKAEPVPHDASAQEVSQ
ncbi:c-type cytochrome, partial [bacterium]|nr:c-type cytochrome [bacterium]